MATTKKPKTAAVAEPKPPTMPTKAVTAILKLANKPGEYASRPALECLHVQDGRVIATDTHRMYISGDADKSRLLRAEPSDRTQGTTYSRESIDTELCVAKVQKRAFDFANCEVAEGMAFPNWKRVIPEKPHATKAKNQTVAFNARYMKEICDLAIKAGAGDNANRVTLRIVSPSKPITVEWSANDGKDAGMAILMPMAID